MSVSVDPISSSIGATVSGMQLTGATDAELAEITAALHEHGVLAFADQTMTRDQQIELAGRLGTVAGHPVQEFLLGTGEPLAVVENDAERPPQEDQTFHVDYSFSTGIPDIAILRPEVLPPSGGDTVWSNSGAAYDLLASSLQETLSTLTATHDAGEKFWFEMQRRIGDELTERAREHFGGNTHPVVACHPVTGRQLLFVNPGYTVRINGVSEAESQELLTQLFDLIRAPAVQYRHRWRPGDVVFWDEHLTSHRGPSDFYPAERRLTRVVVGKTAPVGAARLP